MPKDVKKKVGRPTKYKKEYPEKLLDHMSKGFPFETFAAVCNVSLRTIYEWADVHPDFSQAKKEGETKLYLHYMRIGQGLAVGKIKGNVTAWIFIMKNICGWRDQIKNEVDVAVKNVTPQNIDEIYEAAHLYEKQKRLKRSNK